MKKALHLRPMLSILAFTLFFCSFTHTAKALGQADSIPDMMIVADAICVGDSMELEIMVADFDSIEGVQFSIGWDPAVLTADPTPVFLDPKFKDMQIFIKPNDGVMRTAWYADPVTFEEMIPMLRIKFTAIGDNNTKSAFRFDADPSVPTEFIQRVDVTRSKEVTASLTEDTVMISSPAVEEVVIENDLDGGNSGSIDITVGSGFGNYTFDWSNGSDTEDLTNLPAGDYTVTITDGKGCVSVAGPYVVQMTTGLNDLQGLTAFDLFPNPAADQLNLKLTFEQVENIGLRLYDVTGRLQYHRQFVTSALDHQMMLDQLQAGTYFLEVVTNQSKAVQKVVLLGQ